MTLKPSCLISCSHSLPEGGSRALVGRQGGTARAPTSHPRIDRRATECEKLSASEAPDPGRHHVGTPGDIISECPGDFVGIRTLAEGVEWATNTSGCRPTSSFASA